MADIPCVEVNSDTPRGEVGHTWNMVCLQGQWVHVDATGAGDDFWTQSETHKEKWVYFGFPDALLQERMLHADLLPSCPKGLNPVVQISSVRGQDFHTKVKNAFQENDNQYAIILPERGELDDQTASELVTELKFNLFYVQYKTAEGKMVCYLFHDG